MSNPVLPSYPIYPEGRGPIQLPMWPPGPIIRQLDAVAAWVSANQMQLVAVRRRFMDDYRAERTPPGVVPDEIAIITAINLALVFAVWWRRLRQIGAIMSGGPN